MWFATGSTWVARRWVARCVKARMALRGGPPFVHPVHGCRVGTADGMSARARWRRGPRLPSFLCVLNCRRLRPPPQGVAGCKHEAPGGHSHATWAPREHRLIARRRRETALPGRGAEREGRRTSVHRAGRRERCPARAVRIEERTGRRRRWRRARRACRHAPGSSRQSGCMSRRGAPLKLPRPGFTPRPNPRSHCCAAAALRKFLAIVLLP